MNPIPTKILIFGSTLSQSFDFLDNIIKNINPSDILKIHRSQSNLEYKLILKDGTIYQAVRASNASRGIKCDIAYVSNDVDIDIVDNVIKACLIPSGESDKLDESMIVYYWFVNLIN